MLTYEYRFYPKQDDDEFIKEYLSDVNDFIASLIQNGLVLEEGQNTIRHENVFACRMIAPEKSSLDSAHHNKYNREFLEIVLQNSALPPVYECIGENYDVPDCCDCENPSHYVLYTSYDSSAPPIICGDCHDPVPLYKFPKTYDDSEYYDVLGWKRVYRACDIQFMKGMGERHGYYMIHSPKSTLSKEGMLICRFLEDATGKPFFYFLYDFYQKQNKQKCPSCGEDWVNQDMTRYNYDYVCSRCQLISNRLKSGIERVI